MGELIACIVTIVILGAMLVVRCTVLKDKNPNAELLIELLKTISGAEKK